ncbi:MAG: FAD-dependent oxidoreductase [Rhizobium sp.]|nr:FAD-dependent oxidoreductase [Rhizobium sp.]
MRPDLRRRRLLLLLTASTLYSAPLARRALAEAARPSLGGTQAPASDAGKGLKVVVVGAGMAGLSAAATLVAAGAEVVVLEARDRIGGRIFTDRSLGVPVEQGANFIHGFNGNPVAALASKAGGMPFFVDEEQSAVLLSGGEEPEDFEIDDLWEEIERIEEKAAEEADGDAALSLLDIIELLDPALLQEPIGNWGLTDMWENELGAPLSAISALHFNSGEVYPGPDAVLLQGYDLLPRHLADGLDIRLGEAVPHRHAGTRTGSGGGRRNWWCGLGLKAGAARRPPDKGGASASAISPRSPCCSTGSSGRRTCIISVMPARSVAALPTCSAWCRSTTPRCSR